jgi:hypothetical protein
VRATLRATSASPRQKKTRDEVSAGDLPSTWWPGAIEMLRELLPQPLDVLKGDTKKRNCDPRLTLN